MAAATAPKPVNRPKPRDQSWWGSERKPWRRGDGTNKPWRPGDAR